MTGNSSEVGSASPMVIAHRGARDVAPENTLAAFAAAISAGADGIEMDVQACASGEIVDRFTCDDVLCGAAPTGCRQMVLRPFCRRAGADPR